MDQAQQDEFMASVCERFAQAMNASAGGRLRGQDGYEVLSLVFGETFTPAQLRTATDEQLRDLAMAAWELLQLRASAESVAAALSKALAEGKEG